MNKGQHKRHFWFQTFDNNFTIYRFFKEFKQHFIDRYICVSSFDSSKLHITDEERQIGWQYINDIAISPVIRKDTDIPTAGFDEWYVFSARPSTIRLIDVYVNISGFNLSEDSDLLKNFWDNIELNQPIIYIADGESLKIVTTDMALVHDVEKRWY